MATQTNECGRSQPAKRTHRLSSWTFKSRDRTEREAPRDDRHSFIPQTLSALDELDPAVVSGLNLVPCKTVEDVLKKAVVSPLEVSQLNAQSESKADHFSHPPIGIQSGIGARCEKA